MTKGKDFITIITIILLTIITACGVCSIHFSHSYEVTNQYGDIVKMYGYGIYARDSYFKAPLSIGADLCFLLFVVPTFIMAYWKKKRVNNSVTNLKLASLFGVVLYYAASMSMGVTYNRLHLLYIALFTCSLLGMFYYLRKIELEIIIRATKGMNVFLILAGIAVIVAWLPDILPTLGSGKPLSLIEVYTTEITYVLDMGIIGPLCILCVVMLHKKDTWGPIILAVLLELCIVVGIMIIPQTICQYASGVELPLPALLTKGASFVALGSFAFYFRSCLYRQLNHEKGKEE